MFVTFYSYKGGVGRTLALANAAYALATDKNEPCKVLVWDFDLEAPGLENILGCKWNNAKTGFVDLVTSYLETIKIPKFQDYIHDTNFENIKILPSGFINEEYARKLDAIKWQDIYTNAMGYEFINKIKEDIISSQQFDYVLIDSRTGFSDMGGVCTLQLPELNVLVFRLDDQNLKGIKRIYETIDNYNKRGVTKRIAVLPVISPTWPFASKESNDRVLKGKSIFEDLNQHLSKLDIADYPLQISFESDLISKEKILLEEREKYQIVPKIIRDYLNLARTIRKFNEDDPLTLLSQSKKVSDENEELNIIKKLVKIRPNNDTYWSYLSNAAKKIQYREDIEIGSFLNEFEKLYPANPYPYIIRGDLERNIKKANNYLNKAIALDPNKETPYIIRGMKNFKSNNFEKAEKDFSNCIKLNPKDVNSFKYRALSRSVLENFDGALEDFNQAIKLQAREEFYLSRARIYFKIERYDEALNDCSRIINPSSYIKIFMIHVLAALNRKDDALSILKEIKIKESGDKDALNVAEAMVVLGELTEALNLLNKHNNKFSKPHSQVALFLKAIISIFQGKVVANDEINKIVVLLKKYKAYEYWRFDELDKFIKIKHEQGQLAKEIFAFLKNVIVELQKLRSKNSN